jgi:hypothetical protein
LKPILSATCCAVTILPRCASLWYGIWTTKCHQMTSSPICCQRRRGYSGFLIFSRHVSNAQPRPCADVARLCQFMFCWQGYASRAAHSMSFGNGKARDMGVSMVFSCFNLAVEGYISNIYVEVSSYTARSRSEPQRAMKTPWGKYVIGCGTPANCIPSTKYDWGRTSTGPGGESRHGHQVSRTLFGSWMMLHLPISGHTFRGATWVVHLWFTRSLTVPSNALEMSIV